MKDNKGMSYVFVTVVMLSILVALTMLWTVGLSDYRISQDLNNRSKAYYVAEAGIYYGATAILKELKNPTPSVPNSLVQVDNPFRNSVEPQKGYTKGHYFVVESIETLDPNNYKITSLGYYGGVKYRIEANAMIDPNTDSIAYSEFKKLIGSDLVN